MVSLESDVRLTFALVSVKTMDLATLIIKSKNLNASALMGFTESDAQMRPV